MVVMLGSVRVVGDSIALGTSRGCWGPQGAEWGDGGVRGNRLGGGFPGTATTPPPTAGGLLGAHQNARPPLDVT